MSAAAKILKGAVLAAVLVPVLALGSCLMVLWTGTVNRHWNQKMTVTIETPQGEVSGAAVQRIDWQGTSGLYKNIVSNVDTGGSSWEVTGEAVAVEVSPGRWLFALLKGANGWQGDAGRNLSYTLTAPDGLPSSTEAAMDRVVALPKDKAVDLLSNAYPLLVTFDDINDPKSVQLVDPANLAATFGPGVSLKAVTLAVTDAPVTEGKVATFPFWPALEKQITFSGLQMFDPKQPAPLNYMNYDALLMKGSDQ